MNQLDAPEWGGVIKEDDESPEIALLNLLFRQPVSTLRRRALFLEESGRGLDDPFLARIPLNRIDSATTTVFWGEVEFPPTESGTQRLLSGIRDIGPFPVVCGFVGLIDGGLAPVTRSSMKDLLNEAEMLFSNAYDFESYLVWLPVRPRVHS